SITTYLENTPDDIILNVLPLAFDYGLYQLLMAVKVGATLVLEKSFAFPQAILKLAADEKVTGLPLVPTMAAILLRQRNLSADPPPTAPLPLGAAPAFTLHHQHHCRAAAFPHRAAAGDVPAREPLLHVRAHRMQALPLAAARRAQAAHFLGRHRHSGHRGLRR